MIPPEGTDKGEGSSVSAKTTIPNRLTDIESDNSSSPSSQSDFSGAVDGTEYRVNEWATDSKINPFNIYHCSLGLRIKLTLEDINLHPREFSAIKINKNPLRIQVPHMTWNQTMVNLCPTTTITVGTMSP